MTRENATKQLKRMKLDMNHTGDEYNAIMVAIEALEFRDKYDKMWEQIKTAGKHAQEIEIHHSGRVFKIREVVQ